MTMLGELHVGAHLNLVAGWSIMVLFYSPNINELVEMA